MNLRGRAVLAAAAVLVVLLPRGGDAAPPPSISTVAGSLGTGPGNAVAVNVIALALCAEVDAPFDLAVSPGGSVHVLTRAGRVLRIVGPNAVHVAGSGLPGWSGDGGDARRARLGPATEIAVSRDGRTLYAADPSSHRVRAVRLG